MWGGGGGGGAWLNWFSQKKIYKTIGNLQFNSRTINKEIMIESENFDL